VIFEQQALLAYRIGEAQLTPGVLVGRSGVLQEGDTESVEQLAASS
jgi:hypothetical protein